MHYTLTDTFGRILAATNDSIVVIDTEVDEDGTLREIEREELCHVGDGEIEFDFPADFPWEDISDYRIADGTLVHDPLPAPPPSLVQELRTGQEEQMDALAEVGVMAADSELTLNDLLDAVAELGAIVAGEGV